MTSKDREIQELQAANRKSPPNGEILELIHEYMATLHSHIEFFVWWP